MTENYYMMHLIINRYAFNETRKNTLNGSFTNSRETKKLCQGAIFVVSNPTVQYHIISRCTAFSPTWGGRVLFCKMALQEYE